MKSISENQFYNSFVNNKQGLNYISNYEQSSVTAYSEIYPLPEQVFANPVFYNSQNTGVIAPNQLSEPFAVKLSGSTNAALNNKESSVKISNRKSKKQKNPSMKNFLIQN